MSKNYLFVKYEDLIQNPKDEFSRIADFIGKLTKINFSKNQINTSIELSSFEKLENMEKEHGFIESSINIKSQESALIPTGISIAIPRDTEVQIRPRSGLAVNSSISVLNTPGTIDSDYRGEIKIILFNHGKKDFVVNNNDRVAQMIIMPVIKAEFEEVEILPKTLRGSGGFGSTGK